MIFLVVLLTFLANVRDLLRKRIIDTELLSRLNEIDFFSQTNAERFPRYKYYPRPNNDGVAAHLNKT